MFTGHYAVSFAATDADRDLPLWHLFLATQFLDLLWCVFILARVEKARLLPGPISAADLYFMPYSHSLPAALAWSVIFALIYAALVKPARRTRALLMMAAAVFSHWLFDWISHVPDLPLYGDRHKVGLGLAAHPALDIAVETALLLIALAIYRRRPALSVSRFSLAILAAAIPLVQIARTYGPPSPGIRVRAALLFFYYVVLTAGAYGLERRPRSIGQAGGHENRSKAALAS